MERAIASPSPAPPAFSSPRGVDAIEPLENVRQVFGRDANPGVGDDDAHPGINARGLRSTDRGRRELDRVIEQVERPPAELILVAPDPARNGPARLERQPFASATTRM